MIAVNTNEPVDQADESGKIDLKRRNCDFRSLQKVGMAHHRDGFADERRESKQVADPDLWQARNQVGAGNAAGRERISYRSSHEFPVGSRKIIDKKGICARQCRQTDLAGGRAVSRLTRYLRRRKASTIRSLAIRLAHFTSVAKAVTPYRGRGFGDSMARKITRAQSSGVDFERSRPSFAPAHAPE